MTNQTTRRPHFCQSKKVPEVVTSHPQKISYHKVFGNKEPLKTDNTENIRDNTKAEHSENSKKKHKDISNAEKDDSENFKKNLKIIQIQTKKR